MKRTILLLTTTILSMLIFVSCEEENLINAGSKSTTSTTNTNTGNTTTQKCYLNELIEIEDGETYTSKLTYNTKNILEKTDNNGAISSYAYDANGRVSKQTIVDGVATETFTYSYDAKGNITTIKYAAKNTQFTSLISDYTVTTNSSGQITKVVGVTEDGNVDFFLEYDTKNNIKKVIISADGQKATLVENLTFDDKSTAFTNAGLGKTEIPLILIAAFFGENLTYFMNTNNVLTDRTFGAFSQVPALTTFKYEYTKDGFPSKTSFVKKEGTDQINGSKTYSYNCK